MAEIIPSIIANSFEEVKTKIAELEGVVRWTQLDITDGKFAGPSGWQTAEDLENICGDIKLEAHLMIEKPEEALRSWLGYVDRIIVHLESTDYLAQIIDVFTSSPCKLGIALNMDTPVGELEPYAGMFDLIQLMSIDELGSYGKKLNPEVFTKIKELKERYSGVTISIDGGITTENAKTLINAGADNLVIGSAIWDSGNVEDAIKEFKSIIA